MVKLIGLLLMLLPELLLPFYKPALLKNTIQAIQSTQINITTPDGEATNNDFAKPALINTESINAHTKEATSIHSQAGLYVTEICALAR